MSPHVDIFLIMQISPFIFNYITRNYNMFDSVDFIRFSQICRLFIFCAQVRLLGLGLFLMLVQPFFNGITIFRAC